MHGRTRTGAVGAFLDATERASSRTIVAVAAGWRDIKVGGAGGKTVQDDVAAKTGKDYHE